MRTVTFTMEDALISSEGFMILSGAGLVEATEDKPIYQHITETIDAADVIKSTVTDKNNVSATVRIPLTKNPYLPDNKGDNFAYVMFKRDGAIVTEPYIPLHGENAVEEVLGADGKPEKYIITVAAHDCYNDTHDGEADREDYIIGQIDDIKFDSVLVDFYTAHKAAAQQIEITPDKFGGNFYLEASTLFRAENGVDMPAEFIIPNCKIQSNFTFTMASSGDPSKMRCLAA